jgi:CubicO group peptidase (beta-lactamase class C family)
MDAGVHMGAQCVAYVKGTKVVDLCATRTDIAEMRDYDVNSRQNVFSSSKCLTSIVVAMLVDRGLLRYDQTVASIWPEFAQRGKDKITVAEVMRHEAGMVRFDRSIPASDLTPERLRAGSLGGFLAGQEPKWGKSRREYHALTRGWLVNELCMRVDPKRRTVGQFVREEITGPLGLGDAFAIGLTEQRGVVDLHQNPKLWCLLHCFVPNFLGSKLGCNLILYLFSLNMGRNEKHPTIADPPGKKGFFWNLPEIRQAEVPSANGHATARAIATITACISANNRGKAFQGVTLLSQQGSELAHGNPVALPTFFGAKTNFTNAGWNIFATPDGLSDKRGSVGWMGWGGSEMQWHRELDVGFGFAGNLMTADMGNPHGSELQKLVLDCATRLERN